MSQNAQQALEEKYSYTAYDFIGRITEVGQKPQSTLMTNELSRNPVSLDAWIKSTYTNANNDLALAEQVTKTVYDEVDPTTELVETMLVPQKPYTLRNRVSFTRTYDYLLAETNGNPITGLFDHSTTYSYDIHGNVDTLLQQYRSGVMSVHGDNRFKVLTYKYDQLNRLTRMDTYRGYSTGSNNWNSLTATEDYKERIRYDGNGNILGYLRNGTTVDGGALQMDSLSYHYFADGIGSFNYSVDLDDQLSRLANGADSNYVYDAIGNLIQDKTENITNIRWSVYDKILEIEKAAVNAVDISKISYTYDAAGNRIGKRVQYQGKPDQYTWYTRDASGNVMAVYEYTGTNLSTDTLWMREHHLYGSSRIGLWNRNINMDLPVPTGTSINLLGTSEGGNFERGRKFFELSNHLGNVLATVSDKKAGIDTNADVVLDYFQAELISATDYYPFGMLMPGRQVGMGINIPGGEVTGTTEVNGYQLPVDLVLSSRSGTEPNEYVASNSIEISGEFESGETDEFDVYIADETYAGTGNQYTGGGMYGTAGLYRYGFNGKENDNEVKGTGNQISYEARIYDSRLGRWLSVDPLSNKFAGLSPYLNSENNTIFFMDNDGREPNRSQAANWSQIKSVLTNYFSKPENQSIHKLRYTSGAGGGGGQIGPFGGENGPRYIYTDKYGWIDLGHFFQVTSEIESKASRYGKFARLAIKNSISAYYYSKSELEDKTAEVENNQPVDSETHWSYEDGPSNLAGMDFWFYSYDSDANIIEKLEEFLVYAGIKNPEDAPNYNIMQKNLNRNVGLIKIEH